MERSLSKFSQNISRFGDIIELALFFSKDLDKEQCLLHSSISLKELKEYLSKLTTNFKNLPVPQALISIINKQIRSKKEFDSFRIAIHVISGEYIAELNFKYYKGVKIPTDILTFPYYTSELWGEIFISICPSFKKAVARGEKELVYLMRLFVHGILHLFLGAHSVRFDKLEDLLLEQLGKQMQNQY